MSLYTEMLEQLGVRKYASDPTMQMAGQPQQQPQNPPQPTMDQYVNDYMRMHRDRMIYNMMDRAFYHNLPQQQAQPQQIQKTAGMMEDLDKWVLDTYPEARKAREIYNNRRDLVKNAPEINALTYGLGAGAGGASIAAIASKENKLRNAVLAGLISGALGGAVGYGTGAVNKKTMGPFYGVM